MQVVSIHLPTVVNDAIDVAGKALIKACEDAGFEYPCLEATLTCASGEVYTLHFERVDGDDPGRLKAVNTT